MSQGKRELDADSPSPVQESKKRKHNAAVPEELSSSKNLYKSHVPGSNTAYQHKTLNFHLTLAPIDASDPLAGVEQQMDDILLTYVREAGGILMGWSNPRFVMPTARLCEESPFSSAAVAVDGIVWRPRRGEALTGRIKLMGPSHIGLLILNTFNASIPRSHIPDAWTYEENFEDQDGAWRDGAGKLLEIDQELAFETINIKKGANILSVEGSLLKPETTDSSLSETKAEDQVKETKREEPELVVEPELSKAERKARRKSEKKALKESKQKR